MIPLPNYQVLDFVEWLVKNYRIKSDLRKFCREYKNHDELVSLAEIYLETGIIDDCFNKRVKRIFNKIADDFCRKNYYKSYCNDQSCSICKRNYNKDFCHYLHGVVREYLDNEDMNRDQRDHRNHQGNISSGELVNSLKHYLESDDNFTNEVERIRTNSDDNFQIKYLASMTNDDLEIIKFVEWLSRQNNFIDLSNSREFHNIIGKYNKEKGINKEVNETIKYLKKITKKPGFYDRMKNVIPQKEYKKLRSLEELLERYQRVRYKCIILPDGNDSHFNYENLIKNNWEMLNKLSGDYLDIYVSKNFSKSGYQIDDEELKLDLFRDYLPCIIIWEKKIDEHKVIKINQLKEKEIIEVIKKIVGNIQRENDLDEIIKGINNMVEKIIDDKKPVQNIAYTTEQHFSNSTIGTVIGGNNHEITINNNYDLEFSKLKDAIRKLNGPIEQRVIDAAQEIISEVFSAVQSNNKQKQAETKTKARKFWNGVGKAVFKAINITANFATIASFLS